MLRPCSLPPIENFRRPICGMSKTAESLRCQYKPLSVQCVTLSSLRRRYRLTVDKCIFELWSAPDTTLVLLGILVSLPVTVLSESWPEVERVD